jgi:hypothetical protein
MSKKIKIPVVVRTQDNGDGGYTVYLYNNEDELIKNHPANEEGDITDERREEILSENDPYEDGYISHDEIVLKEVDGKLVLDKGVSFHAGQ